MSTAFSDLKKWNFSNWRSARIDFVSRCASVYPLLNKTLRTNVSTPPALPAPLDLHYPADAATPLTSAQMNENEMRRTAYQTDYKEYTAELKRYNTQIICASEEIIRLVEPKSVKTKLESSPDYKKALEVGDIVEILRLVDIQLTIGDAFDASQCHAEIVGLFDPKAQQRADETVEAYHKRFVNAIEDVAKMVMHPSLSGYVRTYIGSDMFEEQCIYFFVNNLNSKYDRLRTAIRLNDTVKMPTSLDGALVLARKYADTKATPAHAHHGVVATADSADRPSQKQKKEKQSAKAAAVTTPKQKGTAEAGGKKAHPEPKEKAKDSERITYSDPKKPPPADKAWEGMKFCTKCKVWCKHGADKHDEIMQLKAAKVASVAEVDLTSEEASRIADVVNARY